jgi:cellulose synthase/poly-beta-1,6-N-acetylglucosamine synthase-like glycosyltransferase
MMATLALYLGFYVVYNLFLCLVDLLVKDSPKAVNDQKTRFALLIPAHNEELLIGRLIESLKKQAYPSKLYDIIVVADNCNDSTKEMAAQQGVTVLERQNLQEKGKGYAINFALTRIEFAKYDALLIIDADSIAEENALNSLDTEVQKGKKIIQCHNGVENVSASWLTVLMNVSRTLSNEVLEPATNKIGLSSHLVGNGMCFTIDIIKKYGWHAFSVGEDWEQHAKLIESGEKIWFNKNARFYHQESETLKQAFPQRLRWAGGRFKIAWQFGFKLLLNGILETNIVKISGAFPLILPNPSLAVNLTIIGLLTSIIIHITNNTQYLFIIIIFCGVVFINLLLFIVGSLNTKQPRTSLFSILMAPVFLAWKILIDLFSALGLGAKTWVRTERKKNR